jgi:hypothetical protein
LICESAEKGSSSSSSTRPSLLADRREDWLRLREWWRTNMLRSSGVFSVSALISSYQAIMVS